MEKKNIGLGVAALAAGAGAVALAAKNHKNNVKNEVKKAAANAPEQEYRNTERGKNEAKAFIIPTVTMKLLQDLRNRRGLTKKVHI